MIDVPQTSFKQILSKKYCFKFEIMKNSETEKKNRKTLMIFSSRRYIGQYVRLCRNFYRILWALNNLFLCGDFLILRGRFFEKFIGMKNSQRKKSLLQNSSYSHIRDLRMCVWPVSKWPISKSMRGDKNRNFWVCVWWSISLVFWVAHLTE